MGAKEFARYTESQRQASLLAQREFDELWERLDKTHPEACRDVLIEFLPGIIWKYGEMAALAAAEYYEKERLDAGGESDFTLPLADGVPYEQIEASVRYAAGHMFPQNKE